MEFPVEARAFSENATHAKFEIEPIYKAERTRKILKKLFSFWAIAFFGAFIPVAHFVLVPTGLFLGIFLAYRQSQATHELRSGVIACPDCGAPYTMKPQSLNWPLSEICQTCAHVMRIKPVAELSSK